MDPKRNIADIDPKKNTGVTQTEGRTLLLHGPKRNFVDIDPKDIGVTQTQGRTLLSHSPKPGRKELTLPCHSLLQTRDKHWRSLQTGVSAVCLVLKGRREVFIQLHYTRCVVDWPQSFRPSHVSLGLNGGPACHTSRQPPLHSVHCFRFPGI